MVEAYVPVLLMLLVALGIALLIFGLTSVLGPKHMTVEKAIPYESGSESAGAEGVRLSANYYFVAVLFVIFDVEVVFLYPWAATFRDFGWQSWIQMLGFVSLLSLALLYVWKKGALEWRR